MSKKELISLLNKKINKPTPVCELRIYTNEYISRATLFRHLKKLVKSGDLLFIQIKKGHPKKYPTKYYLINNLKTAKKITKFIN